MAPSFSKILSKTDASKRMTFPTKKLALLPPFIGGHRAVDLRIEDETGRIHPVRCNIRMQKYKKPVLSDGWRMLVRHLSLKEKDEVIFFKIGEGHLRIQVTNKAKGDNSIEDMNIVGVDEDYHQAYQTAATEYDHVDGEEKKKEIKLFGVVIPAPRATS